jgi:hypothetical protein
MGVPSPLNKPGAREGSAYWKKGTHIYLFGGRGYQLWLGWQIRIDAFGGVGVLADLWSLDTVSLTWTWLSGSNSTTSTYNYGIKGVPAPTNSPPKRSGAASWVDQQGVMWMSGGSSSYVEISGKYRKFILLVQQWMIYGNSTEPYWVWIHGATLYSIFGIQGVPNEENVPLGRLQAIFWLDSSQNCLWLYGGSVETGKLLIILNSLDTNTLGDFWRFDPNGCGADSATTVGGSVVQFLTSLPSDLISQSNSPVLLCSWLMICLYLLC